MGKLTFSNADFSGQFARKHEPFSTNIGDKPVGGSIMLQADGTSTATIRDISRVHNWLNIQDKAVWIKVGGVEWDGDGLGTEPRWNPDAEEIIYTSGCAASWLNRTLVNGRVVKADTGRMTLFGQNCVFNPQGQPNMDGRTTWADPVFVAPENLSRDDDGDVPWFAVHWSIIAMMNYCIINSVGGGGKAPSFGGSGSSGVSTFPSDVSPGGNLQSALQGVFRKGGMTMVVSPKSGKIKLTSMRYSGGGRPITLPRNYPSADTLVGSTTNRGSLRFDYGHAAVNRLYGAGASKEYEATITLEGGWNPDIEAAATASFTPPGMPGSSVSRMANISENTSFQTYKDVGRKFVANDAGRWNVHYPNFPGTGYDWGTAVGGDRWYARRRPLRDRRLKSNPVTGQGLPPILEYRFDGAPTNALYYTGGWKEFKGKWSLLQDEAGIYIEGPNDFLWHPAFGFADVRITTSFEGDAPLMPYVATVNFSSKYDKVTWVTGLEQFKHQQITTSEHDSPTIIRDDSNRLADFLKRLEDRYQRSPQISGNITVPWIDPGWEPGDWVSDVLGLGMPTGAMLDTLRYEFGPEGFKTDFTLGMP